MERLSQEPPSPPTSSESRPPSEPAASVWVDRAGAPAYELARAVLGSAASVYFRRIELRHGDRVPARGPLLVVANHPASFTDVIVLGAALSRRLHFLAMAPLFRPWIRGVGLRLCGTLPIYRREDDPAVMSRNEDTFRACHEILDRGGAVLIFPEGTSRTDRTIVRVKTGAARLALAQVERPGLDGPLMLLPIGLHFEDRTRFQSEVVVTVGRAIELDPYRAQATTDAPGAVRALTDHIQEVLEKLIVHVPELDHTALVAAIERLYRVEAKSLDGARHEFGIARGVADCVAFFARAEPLRNAETWKRIQRYERRLEAYRTQDRALREMLPRRGRTLERMRLVTLGVLGLFPALVGGLFHYVPYKLSAEAGRLTNDPTRLAAYRIAVGMVLFPLMYTLLGMQLSRGLRWTPRSISLALGILAVLGLHALAYFPWLAHQSKRIRLLMIKSDDPRRIARLRRERRELIAIFEESWREYRVAREQPKA